MADRRTPKISGNPARGSKNFRLLFVLPAVFLLLPRFLAGQELPPESGFFYIEQTGEEIRFIQRLVWEKTEYAYRYEVTVETEDASGEYAEIHREFRTEHFIDLSLAPGLYRYRIQAYNLLNRPAGISDWISFRVLPALQPELHSFSQELPPSGSPQGAATITLYGKNLAEGDVYVRPPDGNSATSPAVFLSEESLRLTFDEPPVPGRYLVTVKNPGGLESSLEIIIEPPVIADSPSDEAPAVSPDEAEDSRKPFDMYIAVAYSPLIPLYGDLFKELGKPFYPGGASARIGFIPMKQPWGDLGLELVPSWNMLKTDNIKIHMGALHLNGIYQWWFHERMKVLVFRSGAGIHIIYGTNSDTQNAGSIFTWMPSLNGGIAFRWFTERVQNFRWTTYRTFYFEIGVDYTHIFSADSPQPGYLRPSLALGCRF